MPVTVIIPSTGPCFLVNPSFRLVISFIRLAQTDFLLSEIRIFLVRAISLLVETIIELGVTSFQRKNLFLLMDNWNVLANENDFFLHFSETSASNFSV